ncbi:fluoride efflux transporter CrcB [Streptococcus sp. SGI.013]|uniref:fluoride efflux transporter CrcB n=1 Tax=unclassified Streptococcus TaxID=2608887 RepID=UPI003D028DB9
MEVVLLALACGIGAVVRYYLSLINPKFSIPLGTLLANLLAAFLIGYFSKHLSNTIWRTILVTGFLGGLGTYSTLNYELFALFNRKYHFIFYCSLTYILGLAFVFLGILL